MHLTAVLPRAASVGNCVACLAVFLGRGEGKVGGSGLFGHQKPVPPSHNQSMTRPAAIDDAPNHGSFHAWYRAYKLLGSLGGVFALTSFHALPARRPLPCTLHVPSHPAHSPTHDTPPYPQAAAEMRAELVADKK